MSDTTSSGGFSSASAYCLNWLNAAFRFLCGPLYSHAKQCRLHTSAQPLPPVSLRAPRSKQYRCPLGSSSAGVGSPSSRHRSMKCSCAAERSFSSDARHLPINSCAPISMPPSPVPYPLSPTPYPLPLPPTPPRPQSILYPQAGQSSPGRKASPNPPAAAHAGPSFLQPHLAPRALQSVGRLRRDFSCEQVALSISLARSPCRCPQAAQTHFHFRPHPSLRLASQNLGPRTRSGRSSDSAGGTPATSVRHLTFALRDARCTTVHHCTRESCSQDYRTETYSNQAGIRGRLPVCRQLPLSLQQLCHRRGRNSSC